MFKSDTFEKHHCGLPWLHFVHTHGRSKMVFDGYFFTAVISKLLPPSNIAVISAMQNDCSIDSSYSYGGCVLPLAQHEDVQACLTSSDFEG
ncbi:hypothetical protein RIF29_18314 [Crotalaria pallida]|uniref:Uncharacterized protein n=1 Tax=Crotalaria pallida TaxID=3830 RepID=A0AAN9IDS9_CROPI